MYKVFSYTIKHIALSAVMVPATAPRYLGGNGKGGVENNPDRDPVDEKSPANPKEL